MLVYERLDHPTWLLAPRVTDDGHYLTICLSDGGSSRNTEYVYCDLRNENRKFVSLIPASNARYRFIDNDGPVFYFQTNLEAPRGRVVAIDTRRPQAKTGER